ncbi:heavy-metal-associated domain-containing protein [Thiohalocapsa marina]|uniref:Heavy-metal-associated domain-containing protein n=1 Tax=Thiohalocapsa marina TaxID=424902 RepID=A0A5M8FNA9_9GAMM|nr:heavy-metal-associated domain-containing protein [Thiohalocapsa marina]KAA6185480.1 heavy-metal-associated domain-containing protein [Thiohalocapsa marina]
MIELHIEGMSCQHCVRAVTEAIGAVAGVNGPPEIDLDTGSARIAGNADPAALIAAIAAAGYQARPRD